ncbi:hypothetical protein SAMN04488144_1228 [Methylobacterium sp. 190mf]|uniref:hypothetical protein n=1 Tax=Methylobacterium sp. 190mf TaxID=1761798 RepID=UPI00089EE10D|nr:hypothetical protein [Methylobacterium sp. 190mf]SEG53909.1 hypothetical protein SAMN04488144_1228 [Methylobacterium sp. 190mf]
MTARVRALARLLEAWDGQVEPPVAVEAVIREGGSAVTNATLDSLLVAARRDLGDVPTALAALPTLDPDGVRRLSARLGWVVHTLCELDPGTDNAVQRFEAALVCAAFWDEAGGFWEAARSRFVERELIPAGLRAVIRGRAPNAHVPANAPVWECEHLAFLQNAERASDWAQLAELARAFPRLPKLDAAAMQALHGLLALDRPSLIRLVNGVESWTHGHLLLGSLPLEEAFRVAVETASPHARFAAVERVVRRERRTLTLNEGAALTDLLTVLAADEPGWPSWLAVFNRYPVRNPHMQESLGRALARASDGALEAYVYSISLSTLGGDGRAAVTGCLTAFRVRADAERRRVLWRSAHQRWRAWDFDAGDRDGTLTGIATTELDYAVVGWLVEGHSESASDPDAEFARGLHELDLCWHASVSVAISTFFRLLSHYQITAHARGVSPDGNDWLPGPGAHLPPAAAEPFVRRRYHWDVS